MRYCNAGSTEYLDKNYLRIGIKTPRTVGFSVSYNLLGSGWAPSSSFVDRHVVRLWWWKLVRQIMFVDKTPETWVPVSDCT